MAAAFETIVLSRSFKFLVGREQVPIMVHEQAIADQSPALSALMQGEMSESIAGETKWTDVDKDTFIRFTQFAYTGNYSVPTIIVKGDSEAGIPDQTIKDESLQRKSEPEKVQEIPQDDPWGMHRRIRESKQAISPIFKSLVYALPESRSHLVYSCNAITSDGSSENTSDVLLIHAGLYVLAEKWGVNNLKALTLYKLHQTLSKLHLDRAKVPHIVQLACYAYSDETTPDLESGIDELRELICRYILANAHVMSEHSTFMDLLQEGGAFVRNLWGLMLPGMPRTG